MSSETPDHDEAIGQFCGVTGADEERAKGLLEACDWNVELAINMHVDTDDSRRTNRPSANNSSAGPSTSNADAPVITIPDSLEDTDDDFRPARRFNSSQRSSRPAASGGAFYDADDIRPPIPPVRQVLVSNPTSYSSDIPSRRATAIRSGPMSDVYDAFRDFQAEAQWQENAINQQRQSQEGGSSSLDPLASNSNSKPGGLQDLYRPPLDLLYRGTFVGAREESTAKNRWLLVNIQNSSVFNCQTLNRDVWSNQTVRDIIRENFIFWQVHHDSFEGSRFNQFYSVTSFPHVAIIDPRTGEQMRSWPTSIDHSSFCDSVVEFLAEHPSPDNEPTEVEDYKDYLGTDTDKFADLMIRFPDGGKTTIKFPWDSPMKALFLFLASHGYRMEKYNFVTNFPRRLLHEVPSTQTMADTNLSRETIFVERKPE